MTFQEKVLSGRKVITAEISPPHGPDVTHFVSTARELKPYFDALNVTDNQRALMRMSSWATSYQLLQNGLEPICQVTCRDRNLLALQSDLLGIQSLGIKNVLCLTGDPVKAGYFNAKSVFEVESVALLNALRDLENGINSAGKKMNQPLNLFKGGVVNPSTRAVKSQIERMEKKIQAGAQFFQTQVVFSREKMVYFMKEVESFKVPVLAGILVVQSLKTAQFLQKKVPGIFVPDELFEALENADDPARAGLDFAIELAKDMMDICQGVHLMAIKNDNTLIDIVERGNLRKVCEDSAQASA